MCRRLPALSEVKDSGNKWFSEVAQPHVVYGHTRRQRIVGRCDPTRERGAATRTSVRISRSKRRVAFGRLLQRFDRGFKPACCRIALFVVGLCFLKLVLTERCFRLRKQEIRISFQLT